MILETSLERVQQREKFDAQIQELTQWITAIKIQRNGTASISLFPDEILFRIILEYALSMDIFSPEWTKVILVCRRWYDIAIRHTQLWSYLSARHSHPPFRNHFRNFLRRSGAYPLTCVFDDDTDVAVVACATLRSDAHRMRSLTVEGNLSVAFQEVYSFPILEHLDLKNRQGNAWELPAFIVEGGAPLLHSIRLSDVTFSQWDMLSNLTDLSLCQANQFTSPPPSLAQLLPVLARSPRLRLLKLSGYLQHHDLSFLSSELDSVSLPELKGLEVKEAISSIDTFLRCLILPATASLNIVAWNVATSPQISSLLVLVRRHLRSPEAPILRSLNIGYDIKILLEVAADTSPTCDGFFVANGHPQFSIAFRANPTKRATRGIFSRILDALPLDAVVHLNCRNNVSNNIWSTVFRHIPRLEMVRGHLSAGVLAMVTGLFEAIRQGARGLSGQKRRRAAQGLFSLPSRLCIVVGNSLSNENKCYDQLEQLLVTYRDMAAPFKPQNVAWPSLEVELMAGGNYDIFYRREKLCAVVQQFSLEGKVWDPVSERKRMEWVIYGRGDPEGNEVQSSAGIEFEGAVAV
ncbi:hypothetical protein BV25DRAFT_836848 [Artomyces pyxidatus]|uniref:Uncharacterized protein n=1 Tax=Artomyces pyxidatus TaxID=48021 RepID=A0ACB8TGT5_9AGAM|nr:hypothetical protein BV25DRAFT_836848 [Artomyces pyxidatus]